MSGGVSIRPFASADVGLLDLQDVDKWALGDIDELSKWEGSAFTVLDEAGAPIGVSGFSVEDGVGTGWLIGSKQLRAMPIYVHRTMKRVIRELLRSPEVMCIHVTVENRSDEAVRWLKRLGFILIARSRKTSKFMTCENPSWL